MVAIAPSILSSDFAHLGQVIADLSESTAEYAHIDVMDGHFVPNLTFGPPVIQAVRPYGTIIFDVHLMIDRPGRYIPQFADAGADLITIHVESTANVPEAITLIRHHGKQVGLSLKPGTPAEALFPYIDLVDLILVMTVEPGFGGQKFMAEQCGKLSLFRDEIRRRGASVMLEVDGGINYETAKVAADAGADILVAGSLIFGETDPFLAIEKLRAAATAR